MQKYCNGNIEKKTEINQHCTTETP